MAKRHVQSGRKTGVEDLGDGVARLGAVPFKDNRAFAGFSDEARAGAAPADAYRQGAPASDVRITSCQAEVVLRGFGNATAGLAASHPCWEVTTHGSKGQGLNGRRKGRPGRRRMPVLSCISCTGDPCPSTSCSRNHLGVYVRQRNELLRSSDTL